ncbi:membrane protein [Actinomadura sp. NBRC 104425]|uniref:four-carbon acid sugar kinase family protein n=1 Tax=Actinomadura sp. NBRC 104425 TaxID=3032204 RepID=UPI0024A4AD6A|nr:four-carbon acid sugar kinase family protein [Actinomadura sp. NBRC 104425]GLZ13916.1 membrane protein [Actinomadura sp. NBRC 104425]
MKDERGRHAALHRSGRTGGAGVDAPGTLVVADDLTGAADAGMPFAARGLRTVVALGTVPPGTAVTVVDTDSRHADPAAAAARVADALRDRPPGAAVLKKVDSTLRGNLAAEIGALAGAVDGPVVFAPAFPATGRTVRDGVPLLDGVPLNQTSAWAAEARPAPARVADALAPLPTELIGLADVRGDPGGLRELLARAGERGRVAVCDAVTDDDLHAIVRAGAGLGAAWAGSAGLAAALAAAQAPPAAAPAALPPVPGRVVAVIGSAGAVARAQAQRLAERFGRSMFIDVPDLLDAGPGGPAGLAAAVPDGDVVIAPRPDGPPDPAVSRRLTEALAAVAAPAAAEAGLLVLTGGETARAVLARCGLSALTLVAEVATGTVLSRAAACPGTAAPETTGADAAPRSPYVITKAGGFGGPETLVDAVAAARALPAGRNPS